MKQDLLKLGVTTLACLILVALLFPAVGCPVGGKKSVARNEVVQLVTVLEHYKTYCGAYPSGTHSKIVHAISGNNPHRLFFLDPRKEQLSRNGEYLDPWGSPYRIVISQKYGPRAYSIGKDRVDDGGSPDSDDVISWRR